MEIHRAARRHGVSDADILHAVDHPLIVVDVDPDADPPKVLVMPLRRSFHDLLLNPEDRDA